MNINEAQQVLLYYRPGMAGREDPEMLAALDLAKTSPELAKWLAEHCARQELLCEKFRQLSPPPGLREQIISEQAARDRQIRQRPRKVLAMALGAVVLLVVGGIWWGHGPAENSLVNYQNRMVGGALRSYVMDLTTNSQAQIRSYLMSSGAPSDFKLPTGLQRATLVGCAVEGWQAGKVSMICFQTGRRLAAGTQSDLWLFVVDRATVSGATDHSDPQFSRIHDKVSATWTHGDKLYLLTIDGDERTLRQYL